MLCHYVTWVHRGCDIFMFLFQPLFDYIINSVIYMTVELLWLLHCIISDEDAIVSAFHSTAGRRSKSSLFPYWKFPAAKPLAALSVCQTDVLLRKKKEYFLLWPYCMWHWGINKPSVDQTALWGWMLFWEVYVTTSLIELVKLISELVPASVGRMNERSCYLQYCCWILPTHRQACTHAHDFF